MSATGVACIGIGTYHFLLGSASVPGEDAADSTVDSRERFYGAIFAGYGAAWRRAARRRPIAVADVRVLSGLMVAGGMGRLISVARTGRPHWFQDVLTAVEFVVPGVFLALTETEERAASRSRSQSYASPASRTRRCRTDDRRVLYRTLRGPAGQVCSGKLRTHRHFRGTAALRSTNAEQLSQRQRVAVERHENGRWIRQQNRLWHTLGEGAVRSNLYGAVPWSPSWHKSTYPGC